MAADLSFALRRALRDIDEGNLTIWGHVEPATDRYVIGLKEGWCQELVEMDLIEPATLPDGREIWTLTDAGRRAIR